MGKFHALLWSTNPELMAWQRVDQFLQEIYHWSVGSLASTSVKELIENNLPLGTCSRRRR